MQKVSRGYKNCNPGNIRINSDVFQGEINPSRDKAFKQFKTMAYGYRAIFKMLANYKKRHSLGTIRGMISRWAPPSDNNHTDNYIKAVCDYAQIGPDEEVDTNSKSAMMAIVAGMSKVENGVQPDMSEIETGWKLL